MRKNILELNAEERQVYLRQKATRKVMKKLKKGF